MAQIDEKTAIALVKEAVTYEELAYVIMELADKDGMIEGTYTKFKAEPMAQACRSFDMLNIERVVTRRYGLRAKAQKIKQEKLKKKQNDTDSVR